MMTPTDSLDLIPGRRRWLIPTIPRCTLHLKERTRRWREWRAGDWWLVARVVAPPVWHGWRSADISLALRHRPAWSDWSPRASEWANEPIGSAMDVKEKTQTGGGGRNKNNKIQIKLTNHCKWVVLQQLAWEKIIGPVSHDWQSCHQVMQQIQCLAVGDLLLTGRQASCTSGWFSASRSRQLPSATDVVHRRCRAVGPASVCCSRLLFHSGSPRSPPTWTCCQQHGIKSGIKYRCCFTIHLLHVCRSIWFI